MRAQRLQSPTTRPWAVWLALCVAFVMALAPTVSHALVWSEGVQPGSLDICTSAGPGFSNAADSPNGQESAGSLNHCPFCLQPTDRVAPPPHPVAYLFLDLGGQPEGPSWQAFFYAATDTYAPPPRGPPAI